MKKTYLYNILMIAAVVLSIITLNELTKILPKGYYCEKIWHIDYSEWGIVPENQHIFFYITSIDNNVLKGKFAFGNSYWKLYENDFWTNSGDIYGTVKDGVVSCSFVRPPIDDWKTRGKHINVGAELTFEKDGHMSVCFKPSEMSDRLVFHESQQSYKPYNIDEVTNIADYMENAKTVPIDTGYEEETFFFKTEGISEYEEKIPFAFLINKDKDILACFNIDIYDNIVPDDIVAEDANGDGKVDIALKRYWKGEVYRRAWFYQQPNGLFGRFAIIEE